MPFVANNLILSNSLLQNWVRFVHYNYTRLMNILIILDCCKMVLIHREYTVIFKKCHNVLTYYSACCYGHTKDGQTNYKDLCWGQTSWGKTVLSTVTHREWDSSNYRIENQASEWDRETDKIAQISTTSIMLTFN